MFPLREYRREKVVGASYGNDPISDRDSELKTLSEDIEMTMNVILENYRIDK